MERIVIKLRKDLLHFVELSEEELKEFGRSITPSENLSFEETLLDY